MLISVSAHVSPPPPGFGFVGLQGINIQRKATRDEDNMKVVKIEIMQIYNESNFKTHPSYTWQMLTAKEVGAALTLGC